MMFRVRDGANIYEIQVSDTATVGDLKRLLGKAGSGRIGYPPRKLKDMRDGDMLRNLGFSNGDVVVVEEETELMVKRIPKDNSCLFNCIGYLLEDHSLDKTDELRRLAASLILSDSMYTDVVLEKPKQEYIEWIQKPTSWGGAIELSVFSRHYQIEIVSIDLDTFRLDRYGSYRQKTLLLYDGSHYDVIVQLPWKGAEEENSITVFEEEAVIDRALAFIMSFQCK